MSINRNVHRCKNKKERRSSLRWYLDEIGNTPVLSRSEEIDLIGRTQQGDQEAAEKLIRSNLLFVVSVAKEYEGRGIPLADLISEGNIGLMRALETFDPNRGLKFITYAVWWIRQAMQHALYNLSHTVRLPQNRLKEMRQTRHTTELLERKLKRKPSDLEVEQALGEEGNGFRSSSEFLRIQHSLDAPLDHGSNKLLINVIPNENSTPPDSRFGSESLKQELEAAFNILEEREKSILQLVYGLGNGRPLTLGEVGERFGLSRERIRQIRNEALAKLRRCRRVKNSLRDYLE